MLLYHSYIFLIHSYLVDMSVVDLMLMRCYSLCTPVVDLNLWRDELFETRNDGAPSLQLSINTWTGTACYKVRKVKLSIISSKTWIIPNYIILNQLG